MPASVSNSDSGDLQGSAVAGEGTPRGPRKPEGGRAGRGLVPPAAARGGVGAPGRQAGPGAAGKAGLVTRDEGRGEDGELGIPGRTARPGQLPDAAGTGLRRRAPTWGRAAVGQRAGCIPRGAEEMAGIPPAAPRSGFGLRGGRGVGGGGMGGRARGTWGRAQALRGAVEGCPGSPPRAPAGALFPGSAPPAAASIWDPPRTPWPCPASWPPNLALAQVLWVHHLRSRPAFPLVRPPRGGRRGSEWRGLC